MTRIFFLFLLVLLAENLQADDSSGSSNYRERFGKALPSEREEPIEEGEEEDDGKGTKGGKTRKKKKKDDDIVIPFGLEKKAPSKVFLEVENGEIIASSYTGFTKLEPAWEPIVWSPIADSWNRDSLGTSVQTALVEGNGFTVVENGILWSPDGHHSSAPEIGQDLGLGETGVLLLGFAGHLSIQGSVHAILRSARILTPGAIAAVAGRALSLAPRVGPRATPAAIISAPSFIILDTVTRPRGPYCPVCVPAHHYRAPHTNIVPNRDALPGEIGYDTGKPNAVEPDGRAWPFHALGIYLAPGVYKWYGWVGAEKGLGQKSDADRLIEEIVETIIRKHFPVRGPLTDADIQEIIRLLQKHLERYGFRLEGIIEAHLRDLIARLWGQLPGGPSGGPVPPGSSPVGGLFPFVPLVFISEEDRERLKKYLDRDIPALTYRDYDLRKRGTQNAVQHHFGLLD